MRIFLFALSLSFFTLGVHAGDIYVKENGSVAEALKQAREWRRLNSPQAAGGIRIHLADAVYPLQKPLFIRPERQRHKGFTHHHHGWHTLWRHRRQRMET